MNLNQIKQAVRQLSPEQRRRLDAWLSAFVKTEQTKQAQRQSHQQAAPKHTTDNKTYRLEGVRCGKENCKCARGKLHGPYWYAYWSEAGQTRSKYLGKKLPKA